MMGQGMCARLLIFWGIVFQSSLGLWKYCHVSLHHVLCEPSYKTHTPFALLDSSGERNKITRILNEFRDDVAAGVHITNGSSLVAVQASNMLELRYNQQCERAARNHLLYCSGSWDQGRHTSYCEHACENCKVIDNFKVEILVSKMLLTQNAPKSVAVDELVRNFLRRRNLNDGVKIITILARDLISDIGFAFGIIKRVDRYHDLYYVSCVVAGATALEGKLFAKGSPCSRCPLYTTCSDTYFSLCSFKDPHPYALIPTAKVKRNSSALNGQVYDSHSHVLTKRSNNPDKFCACSPNHVLCPEKRASKEKPSTYIYPPNHYHRSQIARLFNLFRSKVAGGNEVRGKPPLKLPQAANMRKLFYNNDLEEAAKLYRMSCSTTERGHTRFEKAYCRKTCKKCYDIDGFEVGFFEVKLHTTSTDVYDHMKRLIERNKEEFLNKKLLYSSEFHYSKSNIMIYLLNAEISQVGCHSYFHRGRAVYHMLVCCFGHVHRNKEYPLYLPGRPCSKCGAGEGCARRIPNLCEIRGKRKPIETEGLGSNGEYCHKDMEGTHNRMAKLWKVSEEKGRPTYEQLKTKLRDDTNSPYCLCNPNHVLCLNKPSYLKDLYDVDYPKSESQRYEMLNTVNIFRNQVGLGLETRLNKKLKSASYMNKLIYSYKCELAAREFLEFCYRDDGYQFEYCRHHCKHCFNLDGFQVAMITYTTYMESPNMTQITSELCQWGSLWYEEKHLIFSMNRNYLNENPTPLLLNANVTQFGCGVAKNYLRYSGKTKYIITCALGDVTDAHRERPAYPVGSPCTACPKYSSCRKNSNYPYLCSYSSDNPITTTPKIGKSGELCKEDKDVRIRGRMFEHGTKKNAGRAQSTENRLQGNRTEHDMDGDEALTLLNRMDTMFKSAFQISDSGNSFGNGMNTNNDSETDSSHDLGNSIHENLLPKPRISLQPQQIKSVPIITANGESLHSKNINIEENDDIMMDRFIIWEPNMKSNEKRENNLVISVLKPKTAFLFSKIDPIKP